MAMQPASLQYERVMFISYLDEDLMISRDESGAADVLFRVATEEEQEMERVVAEDPVAAVAKGLKFAADDAAEFVAGAVAEMDVAAGEAKEDIEEEVAGVVDSINAAADDAAEAVEDVVEEGERPAEEAKEEEAAVVTADSFDEENKGKDSKK